MAQLPLMPKATAVWLVDNTSLTFEQIAEFCGLHKLEVKAIADGESAAGIKGLDPVSTGQLTREEIEKGQADPSHSLVLSKQSVTSSAAKRKGPRYTPISRRQDRPNAILWLLKHHPELKDSQIIRLVGTTRTTITAIRERTHWNSTNLAPMDPVTLGLCSQLDLDSEVRKAAAENPQKTESTDTSATLLSAEETTAPDTAHETDDENAFAQHATEESEASQERQKDDEPDADTVFAKLNALKNQG
jgi:hypothetical protein